MNALANPGIRSNDTMKAMVSRSYGGPEVLALEEVAKPVPKTGELLIRNHASVVTAAICHARAGSGLATRMCFGLRKPKWPILGTNFSGVVEAAGSSVTRFRAGDRVAGTNATNFGAFAEYILIADDGAIVPRPANLSDASPKRGAAIRSARVATARYCGRRPGPLRSISLGSPAAQRR